MVQHYEGQPSNVTSTILSRSSSWPALVRARIKIEHISCNPFVRPRATGQLGIVIRLVNCIKVFGGSSAVEAIERHASADLRRVYVSRNAAAAVDISTLQRKVAFCRGCCVQIVDGLVVLDMEERDSGKLLGREYAGGNAEEGVVIGEFDQDIHVRDRGGVIESLSRGVCDVQGDCIAGVTTGQGRGRLIVVQRAGGSDLRTSIP